MTPELQLAVFQQKQIRRTFHHGEWWFVVEDVVLALIDSSDPKQYVKRMKQRDPELEKGWVQLVPTLSVETPGGPQVMRCANTEGLFRIIQSIPSPKAEPFKLWLAKVGYERVKEIENPELAMQRTRAMYKAKGYSAGWIEKRMRSIAVRDELTGEWKKRGVKEGREYAILTSEISEATFGLSPKKHAEFKELRRQNLRDHMTDLELIFSMLGEASTTEIAQVRDAQGFGENHEAARDGGGVAGKAREDLERKTGKKVVSGRNYLRLGKG